MFCIKCGKELSDTAKFCSSCGTKLNNSITQVSQNVNFSNQVTKDSLLRRAQRVVDNFNFCPYIPKANENTVGIGYFECDYISSFDPLNHLPLLKQSIVENLMEYTAYEFEESYFDDIVEELYTKREREYQIKVLNLLTESIENIHIRGMYTDLPTLRFAEYDILMYAHCLMFVSCKTKEYKGLIVARNCLQLLNEFKVEKTTTIKGFEIFQSGHMLSLNQFYNDKCLYKKWLDFIDKTILENADEEIQNELVSIKTTIEKEDDERDRKVQSLITTKVVMCIFQFIASLLCIALLSEAISEVYPPMATVTIVFLTFLNITTCVKLKSNGGVIFWSVFFTAISYPLAILATYLFAGMVLIGIAFVVGLFKFIRS